MSRIMIVAVVLLSVMLADWSAGADVGSFLYTEEGLQWDLSLADSVVLVKHTPGYEDSSGAPFAEKVAPLSDDFDFTAVAGTFHLYGLEENIDLDSVLAELRQMNEVEIANPVFEPIPGHFVYVTAQFIARFHIGVSQSTIDSLNDYYHVQTDYVDQNLQTRHVLSITPETGSDVVLICQAYYESGLCRYAEPNFVTKPLPLAVPNDTYFGDQWNFVNSGQAGGVLDADIDADSAWEITTGSANVVLGIIDFGQETDHEDLLGIQYCAPYDPAGTWSWPDPDTDPFYPQYIPDTLPECVHGTMMAGITSARFNNELGHSGLAPECKLMPIKTISDDGYCDYTDMVAAFDHVHAGPWRADIVSCSWQWPFLHGEDIADAIRRAYNAGVIIFFAAGNYGQVEFPGYLPTVIAVGATTRRDTLWDDPPFYKSAIGDSLDLVAPGADMVSLDLFGAEGLNPHYDTCNGDNDYTCHISGTSLACPQAAATAALVLSRRFEWINDKSFSVRDTLKKILINSAEDQINPADPEGWDPLYGHGRVNAYRALLSVIRGDVNNDGALTPLDVTILANCIYHNKCQYLQPERCVGDCSCDGELSPLDVSYLVKAVYQNQNFIKICFDYMEN